MPIYNKNLEGLYKRYASSPDGLTTDQAKTKLRQHGKNTISVKGESIFKKIFEPFKSVFVLILAIAASISLLQNETLDAIIIAAIILISAVIFYVQNASTARVLKALKKHDKQKVKVLRDSQIVHIDKELLVPGDVIYLSEGEKIPADARIIESEDMRCDEAMLTGESKPVAKHNRVLTQHKEIYEQSNILFQGTFVISGNAKALLVATGNDTELGKIARLSSKDEPISPVQQKIDKLVSQIVIAAGIASVTVLTLSLVRGVSVSESVRFVLSLAVSVVPEGLPVAVSVVLVLGMRRMAQKKALVRNMSAIENIGTATLIATDKTGTLTKNLLKVQEIWHLKQKEAKQTSNIILRTINSKDGVLHDPLDVAMQDYATQFSKIKNNLRLIKTLPFELSYAMSGNIWKDKDQYYFCVKGSPEKILEKCHITQKEHKTIHEAVIQLTSQGYRVIALASKTYKNIKVNDFSQIADSSLSFDLLVAVADELRAESLEAIKTALSAGVKVCMITGDHFETAYAIGKKINLVNKRSQVFDTREIDELSDSQLEKIIQETRVYSRVTPENKHRLLKLFKKHEITAMTGDGVNDVPALTNAHIGIAMGGGSQIAKDAGDIVLLDNNFKSIVSALREGRQIYDNIRRMLFYLLSTNLGEVIIMLGALIVGLPLPLIAVQILWVNLVTDTCFVIPLGLEPAKNDVMQRPPRRANKAIIGRRSVSRLIIIALAMSIIGLFIFNYFLQNNTEEYARTIAFTVIVVMQWANAINARFEWRSIFKPQFKKSNPSFIIGFAIAIILQILVLFGPLKNAMHVASISLADLIIASAISFVLIIFVDEVFKRIYRQKPHKINNNL
jgi:calcium-translocating P-type ATPase